MKECDLSFITEGVENAYSKDIFACRNLSTLQSVLLEWSWCADDAYSVAKEMSDKDFEEFRSGVAKERRGEFAGEFWSEKYSDILLPEKMFKASMVAEQFKVPWSVAYFRLKGLGIN